jgi:diacylglycerol O-acyltransferase
VRTRELPHRLSFQDAAFANFERDSFPMNVGSVGVYDGEIPFARFLAHVDRRIQLVPGYWQRLIEVPGRFEHPAWINDPDFDVRRHVSSVTLPPPGNEAQFARAAGEFFAAPLRRDRPLWEIRLVEGLSDGRTAHLAKAHHCLVDGIGAVRLFGVLFDTTPEVRPLRQRRPRDLSPPPDPLTLAADAVFDRALEQVRLAERVALALLQWRETVRSVRSVMRALWAAGPYFVVPAPPTPWRMRLHAPDRVAWQSLPFDEVRAISTSLGGTINDLALTLVAGGLARYLESQSVCTEGLVLRVGLPVNVRRHTRAATAGNRVSMMLAGLPVGERDARARFRMIHKDIFDLERNRQAAGVEELMERLGELPPILHALTGSMLTLPNYLTNLICTNVPGPRSPLYLLGHRMIEHYPWVPLGWRMGLSVAAMRYDAGLYFGITGDHQIPGDIKIVAAGIRESFDALRETTIVPQPWQRPRGFDSHLRHESAGA